MMTDVYQIVTDRIIAALESGTVPWCKPWVSVGAAYNYASGRKYSLLNQLLLDRPGGYLTFRQADQYGGIVKGAKAKIVVLWKPNVTTDVEEQEDTATDEPEYRKQNNKAPYIIKYYRVFHQSDVRELQNLPVKKMFDWDNDLNARSLLISYMDNNHINFEDFLSDKAYYSPALDKIHLPLPEQFQSPASYYSTAFHEAIHSTGHITRLNRNGLNNPSFGSAIYSFEELIAELGSSMLLHTVELESPEELNQSASYIAGWLSVLKEDSRAIVRAAGAAQKAVKYILDSVGYDDTANYPIAADTM